jgi:uncharacterized protein (DUF58 family)
VFFPRVGIGESVDGAYGLRLSRRGRYLIGPLTVRSRFPLGLIEARVTVRQQAELLVCPRRGQLTRHWTQLIEADHIGSVRALRQNAPAEGDYYGLRHWQSGDSRRWIHWRTSAKLGTLAVRQFERQVHRAAAIVVDLWQPEQPSPRDLAHVELAISFAATAVADLCGRGPSQVQLAVAGSEHVRRSGKASIAYQQELNEMLAVVSAAPDNHLLALLDDVLQHLAHDVSLILVTTRDLDVDQLRGRLGNRRSAGDMVRILHVHRPELQRYFHLDAT